MRLTRPLLDLGVALALLTRMPLPRLPDAAFDRQAQASWAFPLAGLLVGGLAAAIGWLTQGLPAPISAGLVLATLVILTGAMHEDGLADTADGLWGGLTPDRRLAIMRDSRIGTYGVVALILSLGLRWSAIATLLPDTPQAVIVAAVASRAMMPGLMAALPHARPDGLARDVGRPSAQVAAINLGIAVIICLWMSGIDVMLPVLTAGAVAALVGRLARRRLGGITGDILGAAQQMSELAVLLVFLLL